MDTRLPMLMLALLLSVRVRADTVIDVGRFQIHVEKGAQAHAEIADDPDDRQKVLALTVSKPGPEFWSVELRAPGFKFEAGKHYELKFRAKSTPAEYVYFVPEQDTGIQESIALGTTLHIPEQWTDCTVVFDVSQTADPSRITISDLSVDPSSFRFRDFQLIEK
jgi:hypothetical protein